MYKYIFINFMCKWEWPFVFIETKTNKYPLRNRSKAFFKLSFFVVVFFIFILKEKQKKTLWKQFVIETVHGSYWHLFNDLHTWQTLQASDIVYETIKHKDREEWPHVTHITVSYVQKEKSTTRKKKKKATYST